MKEIKWYYFSDPDCYELHIDYNCIVHIRKNIKYVEKGVWLTCINNDFLKHFDCNKYKIEEIKKEVVKLAIEKLNEQIKSKQKHSKLLQKISIEMEDK